MKKLSSLFLFSLVIILMGCPSEDPKKSDEEVAKENLTKVAWKTNSVSSTSNTANFDGFANNITLTFVSTGTYQMTAPSSINMEALPAPALTGNWTLNFDSKTIVLSGGGASKTLKYETLTAVNFVFSFVGKVPIKYNEDATITYNMIP